ncbi:uncharacterized protein Bfra_011004 [Botrytis fragariae]|uniref:Uncharacterized protein n=1 Tax=Botrytis fragariae TaxID=1964551 RepID=A0A8H6EEW7_9HELO|nr:uncharacterized protein Bfra_011004 [Botrytis fragariae]KAF5869804.1 hypothetical protein Bfra_011004 [Botrytis fragariae]
MGQPIHDSSLCDRAKRCINNKLDCSSSQHDRKSVHLSNENQGPPVDGSTRPTVPRQDGLDEAAPNLSPSDGYFPIQGAPNQGVSTYRNPGNYSFVPIPDSARQDDTNQAVPNRPRTYAFVQVPIVPDEDVASPTASEQVISNSRQALTVDQINQALVNEFATVLAIASQIPVHQAAAMQRPVRFTVNQSMAPSTTSLSLQMLTIAEAENEFLRGWHPSDYADISINEISFTLDNQSIASDQTAAPFTDQAAADQALVNRAIIELATVDRLTDTAHQTTAGFLVRLYSGLFKAGGIQRETVRRWIQSGNARLPANIEISGLAVALVENSGGAQIFAQSLTAIRAVDALESEFRLLIQRQRQSMSSSQQERPNDSRLHHSREGAGAVEGVRDEDQDSDAAILFPDNPYLRGFTREEIYAQISTNRYSRFSGSRRGMDGASSGEDRRMEMRNRGRRNAIQLGSGALSPGSNVTVTYSGPPDVDNS